MLVPSFASEPHEPAPQTEHPLLTISILISNHYDNVKHCLDSLEKLRQAVPTQLILTDTGCETKVRQLIAGYGDLILDFPWQKDFAAARNVGVKAALGDWFLFLDDDEWFEDTTPISDFLLSGERDNYDVAMYGTRSYLDPEGKTYREEMAPRLLRRTPELHFVNKVHEEVRGVPMERCKMLGAYVHHYGYAFSSREEQMAKYRRNVELLEQEIGEDPANNRVRYLYVLECTYVRDWGEALHQGLLALKQPVRDEYREAIQVLMVRCYTEMQDWQQVVDQGKIFIKNKLRPYYELGILEYMTEAFWHQNKLPQVCALMEMVEMIYSEYQKDPSLFGSYSLVNMDFYSRERLGMCCGYALSAAEKMGKDSWAKDFMKGPLREFC
jgi:glycosyltransferase involved in cell wall biosynthesis